MMQRKCIVADVCLGRVSSICGRRLRVQKRLRKPTRLTENLFFWKMSIFERV